MWLDQLACAQPQSWVKAFLGLVFTLSCSVPHNNPEGWLSSPMARSFERSYVSSKLCFRVFFLSVFQNRAGRIRLCQHWILISCNFACCLAHTVNIWYNWLGRITGLCLHRPQPISTSPEHLCPPWGNFRFGQEEKKKTGMWGGKWKNRLLF